MKEIGGFPEPVARIMGFDFGSTRGAPIPYAIPNREVTVWRRPMPIPTGSWRGLGLMPNVFAVENLVNEQKHAAGVNPLQFRLKHLTDDMYGQRMRAVLQTAAERAGREGLLPDGHAHGIACSTDGGTIQGSS